MLPLHGASIGQTDNGESGRDSRLRRTIARSLRRTSIVRSSSRILESGVTAALSDPARVIFLDVETTGLSWFYDELTIIGWACGDAYRFHVAGDNPAPFLAALESANALVTFNGTLFDLRFLKKAFGKLTLPPAHIDLRYLSRRVGLTGGQKAIERLLGLPERVGLQDVDGAAAVLLWHQYLRGDDQALARLINYNRCDIIGMYEILDEVIDRLNPHPDLLFCRPKFSNFTQSMRSQLTPLVSDVALSRRSKCSRFETLFDGTHAEQAVIVGIDLTGSEMRPSGYCLLRGREAETSTLASDDEIFSNVISAKPALVSIDSPLSLPFGRMRVEDDDPGRDQFGIMRNSERELKRRGINVYPCLLPSMQRLTARGMRLAGRIRATGIPVIESYPGAAQDIIGIPRKGAGIDLLKRGLVDFGIRGVFSDNATSHDELDAITSAIVGSFFLADRYEALRGPTEDALIIPDLRSFGRSEMVIGISGRICAGKTTAAKILEQKGFAYTRFSLVIDEEIVARGENPDRTSRQRIGIEINKIKGQRWLCEKVLERVSGQKLVVIDGLRFPEDHAFFVERFGSKFLHLHVKAPHHIRASRYRKNEEDRTLFEDAEHHPVEIMVDGLGNISNAILENESSIPDLADVVLNCARKYFQGEDGECLSRLS
jgi:uncharacterized protein YprB with RNaseH-like and TPR domain/predicted nuclease with RNAse H fold/dephospho-CoA kinase